MVEKEMKVIVKNVVPGEARFVVARPSNDELWYYGRWKSMKDALVVAQEVNGILVEEINDFDDDGK